MYSFISRRVFVFILVLFVAIGAKAQENHFLYLQSETGQPFYVKLNNKLISSSSAGYMIIPAVPDGNYNLVVGFPKNQFPEEAFEISMEDNKGFLLKNFGEKGWGLFNMQSMAVIPSQNSHQEVADVEKPQIQNDAFSNMLASVVKDSSILTNHAAVTQPEKIKNEEISSSAVAESPIKRILSEKDTDGMQLVYVDNTENAQDTIRIYVPSANKSAENKTEENVVTKQPEEQAASVSNESLPKEPVVAKVTDEGVAKNPNPDTVRFTITPTIVYKDPDIISQEKDTIKIYKVRPDEKETVPTEPAKVENKEPKQLITIIEPKPEKKTDNVGTETEKDGSKIVVMPKVVTSSSVNSDCKDFATNSDFLRLRKKMASENGVDDMIQEAKKVFRSRCFSTEQIRNLSYLFLTDEGKYMFFDAAYPFASDSDQYDTLVSQLTDDYYITRFNAMIHK